MYKRLIIATIALVVLSSPFVYADSSSTNLTDSQIGLIKLNCVSVESTLDSIHANDALSRVHLGQEYETISTNFMAPMNSRVALAKLDGVALTKTTVDFNSKLNDFRNLYQQYEQTMFRAIQLKCTSQPALFYTTLTQAQADRVLVRQVVTELADLVTQYQQEVAVVRTQALSSQQGGASSGIR